MMPYTAFSGFRSYRLRLPGRGLCGLPPGSPGALIFDQETGRVVDIDPRYPPGDEGPAPGRPRLGVVAREVTLLPRHWDWLADPAGRRLGGAAQAGGRGAARSRAQRGQRRDAVYRFATALVGNAPGYEEAMRALYAGEREDFVAHIEAWPTDVRAKLEEHDADAF